jgi:hypothetical protein
VFRFDKANGRMRNVSKMMDQFGLDVEAFACQRLGLDLRSAIRTCQLCNAEAVCRDWLEQTLKSSAQTPPFCPNARLFARTRGRSNLTSVKL